MDLVKLGQFVPSSFPKLTSPVALKGRFAKASVKQAKTVKGVLEKVSTPQAQRLVKILSKSIPLIEQVITQTCRRVFGKEKMPATEKLLSLFKAHTDIICRGKLNRRVEFRHKVWLGEVESLSIDNCSCLITFPSYFEFRLIKKKLLQF